VCFLVQPLGRERGKFGRNYALNQDYEDLRQLVKSTTGADMGTPDQHPAFDDVVHYTSEFCVVRSRKTVSSIGVVVELDNTQNVQKYKSTKDDDILHFIYTTEAQQGGPDFFVLCTSAELTEPGAKIFLTFFPNSVGSLEKSGSGRNRVLTVSPGSDHDTSLTALLETLLENAHSNRRIDMQ
jgi:hypothetical protein